ncbi:MAG TPA: aspartyl-phosphate phosphatase Spo0E family protein [Bacillota bacterium]
MTTQNQLQNQITQLEIRINHARRYLQLLWDVKGCTDAEVLDASTQLDQLFNEYNRLIRGSDPLRIML